MAKPLALALLLVLLASCRENSLTSSLTGSGSDRCDPTAEGLKLSQNAGSAAADDSASLTQKLLLMNDRLSKADGGDRASITDRIRETALLRADRLNRDIARDPASVLRHALRPEVRQMLPDAARSCLEKRVTITGEMEILAMEPKNGAPSTQHFLHATDGKTYSLHFSSDYPALSSGSRATVTGVELPCGWFLGERQAEPLAFEELTSTNEPVAERAAGIAAALGEQKVAVILLGFSDKAADSSIAQANSLVFGDVNGFIREMSFGQTWLSGTVLGPYTLSSSSSSCDSSGIATQAASLAAANGVDLSPYSRLVYVFPQNSCGWLGLGTIGGAPSKAWINGSLDRHTVTHELGHNLGLYHANTYDCGASTLGSSCTTTEYADTTDVMGNRVPGHYNAFQKERLGWLGGGSMPAILAATTSGNYWIGGYELQDSNPKAIKLLKTSTSSSQTYYYLEYRRPQGFDSVFSNLSNPGNLTSGAVVHTGSTSTGNSSLLLNMNPSGASWYQAALNPGQSFTDPVTSAAFSLSRTDPQGASVAVTIPGTPPPCVRSQPSLSIAPAESPWVAAGTEVYYSLSVKNNDSTGCAAADFSLLATAPPAFTTRTDLAQVSLSPGESASTAIYVTSEASLEALIGQIGSAAATTGGSYPIIVTASHVGISGYDASATAAYLLAPLSGIAAAVSLDSAKSTYTVNESVGFTVSFTSPESTTAPLPYSIVITQPDGTVITRTGTAIPPTSLGYRLDFASCGMTGAYRIAVSATRNAQTATAETTFFVSP